jgi:hypothetical protein
MADDQLRSSLMDKAEHENITICHLASVITLKPATCGHFKTGHFG